jgi:hypothetical protein
LNLKLSRLQNGGADEQIGNAEDDNFTFQQRPSLHFLENTPKQINSLNNKLQSALMKKENYVNQNGFPGEEDFLPSSSKPQLIQNFNKNSFQKVKKAQPLKNDQIKQTSIEKKSDGILQFDEFSQETNLIQTKSDLSKSIDEKLENQNEKSKKHIYPSTDRLNSLMNLSSLSKKKTKRRVTYKKKSISSDFSFSKKNINKNIMEVIGKKTTSSKQSNFLKLNKKNDKKRNPINNLKKNINRQDIKFPKKIKKKSKIQKYILVPQSLRSNYKYYYSDQSITNNEIDSMNSPYRISNDISNVSYISKKDLKDKNVINEYKAQNPMYKSLNQFYKRKRQKKKVKKKNQNRSTSHRKNLKFKKKQNSRLSQINHDDSILNNNCLNETFRFDITHESKNTVILIHKDDNLFQKLKEFAIKNKLTVSAFEQLLKKVKKKLSQ